jgi:hypothetical protein
VSVNALRSYTNLFPATSYQIGPLNYFPQKSALGWVLTMGNVFPVTALYQDRTQYLTIRIDKQQENDLWRMTAAAYLPDTDRREMVVTTNVTEYGAKQMLVVFGEEYDRHHSRQSGKRQPSVIPGALYEEVKLHSRVELPGLAVTKDLSLPSLGLTAKNAEKKIQNYFDKMPVDKNVIDAGFGVMARHVDISQSAYDTLYNLEYTTGFLVTMTSDEKGACQHKVLQKDAFGNLYAIATCSSWNMARTIALIGEEAYITRSHDCDPRNRFTANSYLTHIDNWGNDIAVKNQPMAN